MQTQVIINLSPDSAETLDAMLSALARHSVAPSVTVVPLPPDDVMGPLEAEFMRRNPSRTKRLVMTTGNVAKYGTREKFAAFLLSDCGTASPDNVTESETSPMVPAVPVDELDEDDI